MFDYENFEPVDMWTSPGGKTLEARLSSTGSYYFTFREGGEMPPEFEGKFSSIDKMKGYVAQYLSRIDRAISQKEERVLERKEEKDRKATRKRTETRASNREDKRKEFVKDLKVRPADFEPKPKNSELKINTSEIESATKTDGLVWLFDGKPKTEKVTCTIRNV